MSADVYFKICERAYVGGKQVLNKTERSELRLHLDSLGLFNKRFSTEYHANMALTQSKLARSKFTIAQYLSLDVF